MVCSVSLSTGDGAPHQCPLGKAALRYLPSLYADNRVCKLNADGLITEFQKAPAQKASDLSWHVDVGAAFQLTHNLGSHVETGGADIGWARQTIEISVGT